MSFVQPSGAVDDRCGDRQTVAWPRSGLDRGTPTIYGLQVDFDAAGKVTEVAPQSQKQLTVVLFPGHRVSTLAHYWSRGLSKLANEFASKNVRFVGVNSNSQDSQKEVADFCKEFQISFPIFKDPANKLADRFSAKYMAEVYVLDQTLAVRYHGRVDDQYQPGIVRLAPTRNDLKIAIEELLAGKDVSVARTETTGCTIGRIKTPDANAQYTFCKQVARILNQQCVECHRPGEIGPFALSDYDEVVGWGETMLETIDAGRMPPWNANPKYGHFQNAREMPEADKQVLRDWVKSGMPYGNEADLILPGRNSRQAGRWDVNRIWWSRCETSHSTFRQREPWNTSTLSSILILTRIAG